MDLQEEVELVVASDSEAGGVVSARERDLDNFLLEEISASKEFRAWLFSRLSSSFEVPTHSKVIVGKNPKREVASGQTDLSVACLDQAGGQVALLLIESKVATGLQPDQPDRYKLEVEAARKRLGHRRAAAIVVAPQSHRQVLDHPNFNDAVHLEEIVAHLRGRIASELLAPNAFAMELKGRLEKRIELLEYLAGKRAQSSWSPNPIPERLDFMKLYSDLAREIAPQLRATQSSGASQATTVLFTGLQVPGLNCENIRHDFGKTHRVSLVFRGAAAAKPRILAARILPSAAQIDTTKAGSLLIRISTPPLNPKASEFANQRTAIEQCI